MPSQNLISFENSYLPLFEENPCPMYVYDRATYAFLAVNSAAVTQHGYTEEEFNTLTPMDLRPPEDVEPFKLASLNTSKAYFDAGIWRHKKKDGTIYYAHVFSRAITFRNIEAKLVLAINIDNEIKIEKELEQKIKEVENILESITDGFYALNRQWQFTYINKEFERILQVKREDVLGKTIWEVFPASGYLKFFSEYQKAMNDKQTTHFEECYTPLQLWVSANAYPTDEGIAVFFVDITEQKKIQEKLFNDEQNLRAIINNTKDIIWSIDKNYNVVTANKAYWERIERMTGKPAHLINPEDYNVDSAKTWQDYFDRAFKGETFKITWIENDGDTTIYDEISFNPVYDRNNSVVGISCFSRDVTEQQNYQDRIEKQNKQLRQIAWLQSHKVRNHVANILGLVNLFNYDEKNDPFNSEIIDLVKQVANNMDDVIKEISMNTEILKH